nr:MAG TPA: structural protein [Caudoviricetes sp.]
MEKTLQDICREAKEYQHLTTQDLADLTDLSSSTISNYFSASSKDPSLYKMGLICAALGVSIDEYFGIVKRPTTEEQLAEAHRAMADADAKHSAALRIAHLEGGMEQLTGSVAKHEKKERVLQIWVYILALSLSIAVSIIFGYLAFDSSVPHTGLIRNGKITSLGWMLFALLAVGVGVIIAALINALRYYRHHQTDKNIGQEDKNGKSNEEGQRNRVGV